jgi:hypothetical protein
MPLLQDNCIPYTQDQEWTSKMGLQETKGWVSLALTISEHI